MKHCSAARPAARLAAVLALAFAAAASAHEGKLTFAPVLEAATPAVVTIEVSGAQARNPLAADPLFRHFFGTPRRDSERPGPRTRAAGSGVIFDAGAGYVVTNHHVIEGAEEISVKLKDRRIYAAELVGSDAQTDIALLRIDADDLTSLPLADSDELAVGDFVVAIGNPFNLGQTVTSGIVSALGRRGGFSADGYESFIQTDASINRGNSGGALVDLDGRLVGINTAIISPSGGNAGIGFAVPANIVRLVADQLIEHGAVRRGFLGVLMAPVTAEVARALDLPKAEGVVVSEVLEDSAAQAAGIEAGDVILGIDGVDVVDTAGLRTHVGLSSIGESVVIDLLRDGERLQLEATIGESQRAVAAQPASTPTLAGATMRDLSEDHALYGRLNAGVEIVEVEAGSRAAEAGLRPGDVILAVNRRRVANVREFDDAVNGADAVGILFQRGERRLFTVVG